jgi:hypothetical protein
MKKLWVLVLLGFLSAGYGYSATAKDDEIGTITGTPIQRGDGWLGLEIKDNTFRLTFYNAKKKPVPADASSAVIRWSVKYQPNPERAELSPSGDPAVFTSTYTVKSPHTFILHLVLLFDGKPDASEAFTVNYSG